MVATAIGMAVASAGPVVALIGDIGFLHDSNGLLGVAERGVDVTLVVVDNDGGGIFSFLPQAYELETEPFELLFGTPHGTDMAALCEAHHIPCSPWEQGKGPPSPDGVAVVVAETHREGNVALHDRLNQAVGEAVSR